MQIIWRTAAIAILLPLPVYAQDKPPPIAEVPIPPPKSAETAPAKPPEPPPGVDRTGIKLKSGEAIIIAPDGEVMFYSHRSDPTKVPETMPVPDGLAIWIDEHGKPRYLSETPAPTTETPPIAKAKKRGRYRYRGHRHWGPVVKPGKLTPPPE